MRLGQPVCGARCHGRNGRDRACANPASAKYCFPRAERSTRSSRGSRHPAFPGFAASPTQPTPEHMFAKEATPQYSKRHQQDIGGKNEEYPPDSKVVPQADVCDTRCPGRPSPPHDDSNADKGWWLVTPATTASLGHPWVLAGRPMRIIDGDGNLAGLSRMFDIRRGGWPRVI